MNPKVIFFGTPEFAAHILHHLVRNGVNVVAAVTVAPKEQGRGLKIKKTGVHEKADELNLPVLTPDKLRDESFVNALKNFDADIFCVVAYRILPKEVYTLPTLGAFNVHTSLLPKYRGAAPMQRALINGERETGITTFLLEPTVDAGRILLQQSVAIGEDETLGQLHDDLMAIGATLALQTINGLITNSLIPQSQDNTQATPAPKITPEDCVINANRSAEEIHNQIRGLSPIPGAVLQLNSGEKLKIYRSHKSPTAKNSHRPNTLLRSADNKHLYLATATEALELLEVQREGKRKMSAEEYLRGIRDTLAVISE